MSYVVKELCYTLQGEGAQAGRPCVLLRFTGCNLWTGLESHRSSAICRFCDTDFRGTDGPGGSRYPSSQALALAVARLAPPGDRRLVVCTGGEPTLQMDDALVDALHERGFEVAIETNGTNPVTVAVEWICVSPKAGAVLRQTSGSELKVVFPQPALDLDALLMLDFEHFFSSRWTALSWPPTPTGPSRTASRTALASERANPQDPQDPVSHRITKTFRIEAAHFLPATPEGHKCRRMHGHSFVIRVHVAGPLDDSGWVVDFDVISEAFAPLHDQLDHRLLNDVPGLENPTSELLAAWVYNRLVNTLEGLWGVEVEETCTSSCLYAPSAA